MLYVVSPVRALVLALLGCAAAPVKPTYVDWRTQPVKRVAGTTPNKKVAFTIEVLTSMREDGVGPNDSFFYGPSIDVDTPTIFVTDAKPQSLEQATATVPDNGTRIVQREQLPDGWWVAFEKPSHLIPASGKTSYTRWIQAQRGALECRGYYDEHVDQLQRVVQMCLSLQQH